MAMAVALPTLVTGPVKLAFVVTVPAVSPAAVPVIFVPTSAVGVPKSGVTKAGEVAITKVDPVPVCEATLVAFPMLMMGPVRLAFVVTVAALPVVFWFRIGKSPAMAIEGTPVPVVFFSIPVPSPAREVPLIFCTVLAPAVPVTSPTSMPATMAFQPLL